MKFSIDDIIPLIPEKDGGLITAKRLSTITGHTQPMIRKLINVARSNGVPICSTRYGYYFSTDHADITDTVKFLTRQVNTQLRAINGLKQINVKEI